MIIIDHNPYPEIINLLPNSIQVLDSNKYKSRIKSHFSKDYPLNLSTKYIDANDAWNCVAFCMLLWWKLETKQQNSKYLTTLLLAWTCNKNNIDIEYRHGRSLKSLIRKTLLVYFVLRFTFHNAHNTLYMKINCRNSFRFWKNIWSISSGNRKNWICQLRQSLILYYYLNYSISYLCHCYEKS